MIRILSLRSPEEIRKTLRSLEVDEVGVGMMAPKAHHYLLLIESLNVPAANILKQEMLSLGGDAALHHGACNFSVENTPCLLIGTYLHFQRLLKKLQAQPFGLKKAGKEIRLTLERFLGFPPPVQAGEFQLNFDGRPLIMGIINVTPDSFCRDGIYKNPDAVLLKGERMVKEGADILDIGGESSRPGSTEISLLEELERVIPAVKAVSGRVGVPISVDTTKAEVASKALECGAHIVNDVWGMKKEPDIMTAAKDFDAPVIVMHNKKEPVYQDLVGEISAFFQERLQALEKFGIAREKIILDPGIGFGKTPEQNLVVLKNLREFKIFGRPLLLGTSRKSFIRFAAEVDKDVDVKERLPGSLSSAVLGFASGFHIFRVHDVPETRQALNVAQSILEGGVSSG